jgi:hypothetical protein
MKNLFRILISLVVTAIVLAACASTSKSEPTPAPQTATPAPKAAAKFVIIDHKNAAFGGDIPDWVTMEVSDIEAQPKYKDQYAFVFDGTGDNLEGTRLKVNNLNAAGEIARFISVRVQALFAGAQAGDDKNLSTYMENIVKSLAQVQLSGFRKISDYWVQRQFTDTQKTEFNYKVLYVIDKATIKQMLADQVGAQKADTPEQQTAQDKVKKIIDGNLPTLNSN